MAPPYGKEGQRLNTGHLVTANSHQEFEPGGKGLKVSGKERGKGVPIVWPMEVCLTQCVDENDTSVLCNLSTLFKDGERLQDALKKGSMGVGVALRQRESGAE